MSAKDLRDLRFIPYVAQARIECDRFELECPSRWGELRQVDYHDPQTRWSTRSCDVCQRVVRLVTSDAQLIEDAPEYGAIAVIRPEEVPEQYMVSYRSNPLGGEEVAEDDEYVGD